MELLELALGKAYFCEQLEAIEVKVTGNFSDSIVYVFDGRLRRFAENDIWILEVQTAVNELTGKEYDFKYSNPGNEKELEKKILEHDLFINAQGEFSLLWEECSYRKPLKKYKVENVHITSGSKYTNVAAIVLFAYEDVDFVNEWHESRKIGTLRLELIEGEWVIDEMYFSFSDYLGNKKDLADAIYKEQRLYLLMNKP